MFKNILLGVIGLTITLLSCDNYSHNSYVNTNPANYINISMVKSVGGSGIDWGTGIIKTFSNGYVATGSTDSYGAAENSLYLVYVDSNGVVDWTNFFGGWGNDNGEDLVQNLSGDYIVVGATSSYELATNIRWDPTAHPYIVWDYNFYLIKVNLSGYSYWTKVYGTDSTFDWGTSIVSASDGFVLAGYQRDSSDVDNADFFVVKTSSDGDLIWQNPYGTPNNDRAYSITLSSDGGFVVGGFTEESQSGVASPYIIKINSDGDLIWDNIYGNAGLDEKLFSIIETSDGGFVATGISRQLLSTESSLYAIKISSSGAVVWENTYPQSKLSEGRCVIENNDGSLVICGANSQTGNINITKLEADGHFIWSQNSIVPGTGMDLALIEGGYALTGFATSLANPGSSDMLILEIIEDFSNIPL